MTDTRKPRTLVLCFDGTASQYDAQNTNVVRFYSLLGKDDPHSQLCYYQPGIGTYFNPGVVSPLFEWWAKILDEAFAWYLDVHVMDGYRFLMQNYHAGDKICLFGFSRGAYTARALGGFLHKIGLLLRGNEQQVPFAYKLYKRTDTKGLALCAGFKETYCLDVKIEFIGVWDTVASVGIISSHSLPFISSNNAIRTFRHALSLDERRCKFSPNTFHRPTPGDSIGEYDPEHHQSPILPHAELQPLSPPTMRSKIKKSKKSRSEQPVVEEENGPATDVLEVWFAGCHSDVGGGSVPNETEHELANITLRWMVQEIMASQCGILFDEPALVRDGIPITPSTNSFTIQASSSKIEPELDATDAVQPIYDQLVQNKLWWILEIMPFLYTWQDVDGRWHKQIRFVMLHI
ncbi:hypothetical protein AX14_009658 [Amanita brunnescens Koide BX004]|nr:hypothetical protein AX14_009658 [Amanita brunnescens Koide BX004]